MNGIPAPQGLGLSHARAENGPLLACQDRKVLALFFVLWKGRTTPYNLSLNMILRGSKHPLVPKKIQEENCYARQAPGVTWAHVIELVGRAGVRYAWH
jgi:hypothetical protein